MRVERTFTCGQLSAQLHMLSREGSFDHARHDELRLLVSAPDSAPNVLTSITRLLRDHEPHRLHPFTLTRSSAHRIMLAMNAAHSTRYERAQLIDRASERAEQIMGDLDQMLGMERPAQRLIDSSQRLSLG